MGKIYAYLRTSTDSQDLENQRFELLEYAQKNGFVIDEFVEAKVSSTKSKKERLIDQLVETVQPDDTLIVSRLDRLGRTMFELISMVNELLSQGVKLIFVNQPELNADNGMRDLLIAIWGYMAETERKLISERTKAALAAKRASGQTLGRPKGSKSSKLDPHLEEITKMIKGGVRQNYIAEQYGVGPAYLSRYLKDRGVK